MFGKELPCTIATDLFYIKLIANKTNFISSVIRSIIELTSVKFATSSRQTQ